MSATQILILIAAYFGVLILISYFTGKNDNNDDLGCLGRGLCRRTPARFPARVGRPRR